MVILFQGSEGEKSGSGRCRGGSGGAPKERNLELVVRRADKVAIAFESCLAVKVTSWKL